ncbi:MAG: hypothetical protein E5V81_33505, partial [Mesorhizobium sp.]
VVVYEIDQKSFAPLLLARPEMAEDLAAVLATGMSASGESGAPEQRHANSRSALIKTIQTVFRDIRSDAFGHRGLARGQEAMTILRSEIPSSG